MIMMIMTIIIIFHFTDLDHMEYIYYYNHNYIHNYIPYVFHIYSSPMWRCRRQQKGSGPSRRRAGHQVTRDAKKRLLGI